LTFKIKTRMFLIQLNPLTVTNQELMKKNQSFIPMSSMIFLGMILSNQMATH